MGILSFIIFMGLCIYHACELRIPAEYHRNWRLKEADLQKIRMGQMTQAQFMRNIRRGKYR